MRARSAKRDIPFGAVVTRSPSLVVRLGAQLAALTGMVAALQGCTRWVNAGVIPANRSTVIVQPGSGANETNLKIGDLPSQYLAEDSSLEDIAVPITGDPAGSILNCASDLLAVSTNDALVESQGIRFTGTFPDCTMDLTPEPDQHGAATINVALAGGAPGNQASFELTVVPINDSPSLQPTGDSTLITAQQGITPVTLATATDPDVATDAQNLGYLVTTLPAHGTLGTLPERAITGGTVSYTPAEGFVGTDLFVYQICDDFAPSACTESISVELIVTDTNKAPSDIALSNNTVPENAEASGNVVGSLSTADPDASDTFVYTLVDGDGGTDNAAFTVAGSELRLISSADFETKASYGVRVRSTDAGGLFFEKSFTVAITNINEAPSSITLSATSLAENTAPNFVLGTVSSTDPDAGDTASYALLSTGDHAAFDLTGTTLTLKSPADYESKNSYTITVRATDSEGNTFDHTFSIAITNINEPPTLAGIDDQSTNEDVPLTNLVAMVADPEGDLTCSSALSGTSSDPTLLPNSSIDASGSYPNCSLSLSPSAHQHGTTTVTLTVSDGEGSASDSFVLTVTPVNDVPSIASDGDLGVLTAQDTSTSVALATGGDPDVATAGQSLGYLVSTGPNHGTLGTIEGSAVTGGSVSYTPELGFIGSDSFVYQICDTFVPPSCSQSTTVNVTITDVNEAPTNLNLSASSLTENAGANALVGTLSTTDPDANESFVYSLVAGAGDSDNTAFSISGNELRLNASADFESKASYSVRIQTRDQNGTGLTFQRTFTIDITNVNEGPTNLSLSASSLAENAGPSALVGTLSSTDPDASETFVYTLVAGTGDTDNAAFSISDNELRLNASADFESKSSYTVRIQTRDQNGTGLTFQRTFTIDITNVNEGPTNLSLSSSSLAENAGPSALVGTLSTTDPDASDTFVYSLVAGTGDSDNAAFSISGNELRLSASADFETKASYAVRIQTRDQNGAGLTFASNFIVTISNVNEGPTNLSLSASSLAENAGANALVGTLSTSDPDASESFVYSLVAGTGDSDNAAFSISGHELRLNASANFESKSSYAVRIQTRDQNGAGLTFAKNFTISITNVNEGPTNLSLSASSLSENAGTNALVGTLSTTDPDASDTFVYTLVAGTGDSDNAAFSISSNELLLKASADFETKASYTVRIQTRDQNGAGLSFEKAFTITITNVNEGPTNIALSSTSLAENAGASAVVGNLSTTDPDANESFVYSLVAGTGDSDNAAFSISGNELRLNASADFDTKASYAVRIQTRDQNGTGLTFASNFTVTISNVNEAPTNITLSVSSLAENAGTSALVGTLSTTDPDASESFVYSLVAGLGDSDNTSFNISGNELRLNDSADFESKASYAVRIQTRDQNGTGLTFQRTFTINITNVNEAPTSLVLSSTSLAENAGTNAIVGTLSTTDPDASDTFVYTLVAGTGDTDNAAFSIIGSELRLNASADFESKASYAVRIQTRDQNGAGLTFASNFIVTISNVNEAPINMTLSSTSLAERAGANALVGTLSTTDPDANESFVYSLVAGTGDGDNAAFSVSGTELRLNASADFETKASYAVRIQTRDQNGTGLTYSSNFTISITNVNEGPVMSDITGQTINEDGAVLGLSVTIGDPDGNLACTGALSGSSSNTTLLPNGSISISGTSTNGAFSVCSVSLTPAANQNGTTTITLTASDGSLSAQDSFVLTVSAVNDAPIIATTGDTALTVNFETPGSLHLATATDVDVATNAQTLAYIVTEPPLHGTLSNLATNPTVGGTLTYTPGGGFSGADSLSYQICDSATPASCTAPITVGVTTLDPGWRAEAYLKAPNAEAGDVFGISVSLSGDTLAASALSEDEAGAIIVNGSTAPNDNGTADSGAVYIYRRSGASWASEAYIKAANAQTEDFFGLSLSLSGNTLAVGAHYEDENSSVIVNGSTAPNSNGGDQSGAVYVYRRTGSEWAQEAYIKASNAEPYDYFGSVSLSGDTLAVGAAGEAANGTVIVNGTAASSNNSAPSSGAVYVYRRNGTTWRAEAYIKAPNAETGDLFGLSLSLFGDTLAVGASGEDENSSAILNGTTALGNNGADDSGAVYVYRRGALGWAPEAYIKAANAEAGDQFGYGVSLSGDTLAVGAPGEDEGPVGITNGTEAPNDNGSNDSGAVYLYRRSSSVWVPEAYIKAANAEPGDTVPDVSWQTVSLAGDTLAVGAKGEDENSSAILNTTTAPGNNGSDDSGAVYVYRRGSSGWAPEAYIKAANAEAGDSFGQSVSLSGDTIAVGAPGEDEDSTVIVNGTTAPNSNQAADSGAVYVFRNRARPFEPVPRLSFVPGSSTPLELAWDANLGSATDIAITAAEGTNAPETCEGNSTIFDGSDGSISFASETLSPDTAYSFRICTVIVGGESPEFSPGVVISGRTPGLPPQVQTVASTWAEAGSNYLEFLVTFDKEPYLSANPFVLSTVSGTPPEIDSLAYSCSGNVCQVGVSAYGSATVRLDVIASQVSNLFGNTMTESFTTGPQVSLNVTRSWQAEAFIKAANAEEGDSFGDTVALSGNTLAVGALGEDASQTTVSNGTSADSTNTAPSSGAVYVYRRSGVSWAAEAYIKAANAQAGDGFGSSLALSGDTLAVGTPGEDENSSVIVNGTVAPNSNGATDSGAVYVYRRSGLNWAPEAYLKAPNAETGDGFGNSVSLSGDTLAVGAPSEDENSTVIINGTTAPNTNGKLSSGAVYIYRRTGSAWTPEAYIKAGNSASGNLFAATVSLSGDTVAVGDHWEKNIEATIVNGSTAPASSGSTKVGAVYVYRRGAAGWAPEAYIKAGNANHWDEFGISLTLDGDTLAVGARLNNDSSTTIVNSTTTPYTPGALDAGAAYVFRRSGVSWAPEAYIKAANAEAHDWFGTRVALSGNTLAVSAPFEDGNRRVIIQGTKIPNTNGAGDSGAVYVYSRAGSLWSPEAYIKASNADANEAIGWSMSLSGDTLAVGSPRDSENSTVIVNGSTAPNSNGAGGSGAVLIYRNKARVFDPELIISSVSDTSVTFTWRNDTLGSGSSIRVAPYVVGTGSPAASCTDGSSVTLGSGVSSHTISGLTANTRYGFRFCATGGTGTSAGTTIWVNTREPSQAPVLGAIANQEALKGENLSGLPLSVSDPNGYLICSNALSAVSSNATLLTNSSITFSGNWPACTMSLSPVAGQVGQASVTVTLSDGALSDQKTFVLSVSDGWRREAYLKAANADFGDLFGLAVSLSGDTLAVGAPSESENSTVIINGSTAPNSNEASISGAVYVYRRTGSAWAREAYIKAANAETFDLFGSSVALSGSTLAVGAPAEDENASWIVNGTTAPANLSWGYTSGAVYVYRRNGTLWSQEAYIKAANANNGDYFGYSVSLSGETLAVGTYLEDENSTAIVNGTTAPDTNMGTDNGAVYVYRRTGSAWTPEAYIKAANTDSADYFGHSISLSGDTLAVGAYNEDENSTAVVNGTTAPNTNGATDSGAVYLYRRSASTWAPEAYLKAANTSAGDSFGYPVSLSGDTLAVGAYKEDSNQTTVTNGTLASTDNSATDSGAVYVYRRSVSTWAREAYIKAANAAAGDSFGSSVSLLGNTLAVGAHLEDENSTVIVNGTTAPNSNGATDSGAAYVYRRLGSTWAPEAYIKAANNQAIEPLGSLVSLSVSLSADTLAVGIPLEDENSTTIINGSWAPNNTGSGNYGAVYVYRNKARVFDPDVTISAVSDTSITFTWRSDALGTADRVLVAPYVVGTGSPAPSCTDGGTVTLGSGVDSHTISGLTASTKYGFRFCSTDGAQSSAGSTLWVNTREPNQAPILGTLSNQEGPKDEQLQIPLAVNDGNGFLICSANLSAVSDNTTLIPNSNITFSGNWPACSMRLIPAPGQIGQASITVTVSDGSLSSSKTFDLKITEGWQREAYIKAANAGIGDQFGWSVSLSGDTLAVGAPYEDENSTTVSNGTSAPNNNGADNSGAAYVYRRTGTTWAREAYIKAANAAAGDLFGDALSLSGDTLTVATYGDDENSTAIVNGTTAPNTNGATDSGAVYIYRRTGSLWAREAFIKAPNAAANDYFGWAVSVAGNLLAVGAPGEDENSTAIVNGSTAPGSDGALNSGAVYVYRRSGSLWTPEAYIKAANASASDEFGVSVSLTADTLAVGAALEDENSNVIVNGTTAPNLNAALNSGAVYVYRRTALTWAREAYIKAANVTAGDYFGEFVSLSGDTLAVAARLEDENTSVIVNGTTAPNTNGAADSGAVYLYRRSGSTWAPESYIKAANVAASDKFGWAVNVKGDTVAVGSNFEDENSTAIVNGTTAPNVNGAADSGAVYVYRHTGSAWAPEGYIKAANSEAGDQFGWAISLSGDTFAIGAPTEDENSTTIINGTTALSNNGATDSGAVYVYRNKTRVFDPDMVISSLSDTSITFTWQNDNLGTASSVRVAPYVVGNGSPAASCTDGGTVTLGNGVNSHTISGLTASTKYGFRFCSTDGVQTSSGAAIWVNTREVNQAPVLGAIAARQMYENDTLPVSLTVSDTNGYLICSSALSATSSNSTLMPNSNITFSGNWPACIMNVSPAPGQTGTATITVTLSDGTLSDQKTLALTVTRGWKPEAYLKAANAEALDRFGGAVSISGDTLAVGAPSEDENSMVIVNGVTAPNLNGAGDSGAVYLYRRTGATWAREAYIKAANAGTFNYFGHAVSLSGDTLAVGAYWEDENSTVIVNGTTAPNNNGAAESGAVYVYRRTGTAWAPEAYIKAANAQAADNFGQAVSLSGDSLAVGAPCEDSNVTTITNGTTASTNNTASCSGAGYVYRRTGTTWAPEAFIKAANTAQDDYFGYAVSLSSDTLAVGAYWEDENSTVIINGTTAPNSNGATDSGAVYVYRRMGTTWARESYIKAANASMNDSFGYTVSISGDTLAVGANFESENSTLIVNGTTAPNADGASSSGAVYVYRRTGTAWAREAYIKAANAEAFDRFGEIVSLAGNTLAVGAIGEDENSTLIVNGTTAPNSNGLVDSGAVYVYRRTGTTWASEAYIKAANAGSSRFFGSAVSLSGDTLAVGNANDAENTTTLVNGTTAPNLGGASESGAVYVYRNTTRVFDPDVRVSARTQTSITFAWSSSHGTGTQVVVAPAGSGTANPGLCSDVGAVTLAAGTQTYTYSGLTAGTKYGFRFCATDGVTRSPGSVLWFDTSP